MKKIKKISEINQSSKITFSITIIDTHTIIIDKYKNIILHNDVDVTDTCINMLKFFDSSQNYTGGVVMAKILNGTADIHCRNFINYVADNDSILLE